MGALIRSFDWSRTPIGAASTWSPALRTTVDIVLANSFPMLLWWGPEYVSIYNDAYRPILGQKHPWGLGRPVRECWSEIWHILKPLIDTPFHGGPATWMEDIELEINRSGFIEETHFTIAYSAVRDETANGGAGGVLATVHEITDKVVGERRIVLLRDLGARAIEAKSAVEACRMAAATLASHPKDIPFALLYVTDPSGKVAHLAASCGIQESAGRSPASIELDGEGKGTGWPLAAAQRSGEMQVVDDAASLFSATPEELAMDTSPKAVVLPIRTHVAHQFFGFFVAGVSSRLPLDEGYRNFLELATGQIGAAIANAQAYDEERRRAEALAELDRAKTVFFSNVSHEFRTPLTLMLGPLENVLAKQQTIAPEDRAQLEAAHRNSLRLLKLVNSLLDFSRIEAGRVKASYEPIDLAEVTSNLASSFRSAVEAGGLDLEVDCPPLPEPVYADRDMWEKIVLNLLSNAFKFTFEGRITVTLKAHAGRAILTVADTGVGIPETDLPHIFERFRRVEGTRGRTYEGTGIGLALIQELIKRHGGTIQVKSRLGEGSIFSVSLPFGTSHLPADRIGADSESQSSTAVRVQTFTAEARTWVAAGPLLKDGELTASRARELGGYRPRILLADDNSDMREYVAGILGPDYDLTAVADGRTALEEARRNPPDLILSDVMMPSLDGFGLVKKLREDERLKEVPVVLLSARAGEESRVEGLIAGADDYLTKPFSARELSARVASSLRLARMRREYELRLAIDLEAMTLLNEVGTRCIRMGGDFEGNLKEILAAAVWIAGSDKGNIQLLDGGSGALQIAVAKGFDGPFLTFFEHVYESESGATCGAALRRGERIIVEDVTTSPIFEGQPALKVLLDAGVRAVQSTPLISSSGRAFGMITTHFGKPHRPSERDLRLLDLLAIQAADYLERKEMEKELRRVNADLEQFAYSASHDLQEPLRTVKIFSELLGGRYSEKLDGQAHEFLDNVQSGATRMEALVRDLLSYIQASRFDQPLEPVDAKGAFDAALANLAGAIQESDAQIECDPLPSLPVHATQLQQLFQNLVGNAIKYRGPGVRPLVHLSAKREYGKWYFAVQDNGIGIEPENRERIFGLFKRLHTADRYSGTGIGLAICQRIVERYRGRIWVESELGKGSTFYFTLPARTTDTTLSGVVTQNVVMTQPNDYPHLVTWFEIPAADLDRAAKFYSDVLGMPMKVEQAGPERLSIFPHQKPSVGGCVTGGGQPGAAGVVLYLNASPSLDGALSRVAPAGGEVVTPRTALPPGKGFYAKIRDTEGNVVGLHSMA